MASLEICACHECRTHKKKKMKRRKRRRRRKCSVCLQMLYDVCKAHNGSSSGGQACRVAGVNIIDHKRRVSENSHIRTDSTDSSYFSFFSGMPVLIVVLCARLSWLLVIFKCTLNHCTSSSSSSTNKNLSDFVRIEF